MNMNISCYYAVYLCGDAYPISIFSERHDMENKNGRFHNRKSTMVANS